MKKFRSSAIPPFPFLGKANGKLGYFYFFVFMFFFYPFILLSSILHSAYTG